MKETSPKRTRLPFRHQAAERKSNNHIIQWNWIRAGVFACLFLFHESAASQDWQFTGKEKTAYDLIFRLRMEEARLQLPPPHSATDRYLISLADAIELLITEDAEKFQEYERRFEQYVAIKSTTPFEQFVEAEIHLHWTFVYLKFGHEMDAAFNMRSAYTIGRNCRKKNPAFIPIRKTTGLLEVMIGAVPEKYGWLLSLLGLQGSVNQGLKDLAIVGLSNSDLAHEAQLLSAVVHTFVLQKPDVGMEEMRNILAAEPDRKLLTFLAAVMALKNSESAYALTLLESNDFEARPEMNSNELAIAYAQYLRAEAYLHKGSYDQSVNSYRSFLATYRGGNYVKDAYFKTGLCYWLKGEPITARTYFEEARTRGQESTEADKHAARTLMSDEDLNIPLSKVRYFTDGGFYRQADSTLRSITPPDLRSKKDEVEFYYRKARLEHKQLRYSAAKLYYRQTVDMSGTANWYFAPNACLQLGYIALAEGEKTNARNYFLKALEYKRHEYKNSVDAKAKSALSQLKVR